MFKIPQRQVHLDFHTSGHIDGIGSRFDREQFKRCLKLGHVNSITVFAKCHHGWSYYPSESGTVHPGLKFDLLGEMLAACREAGVEAPVYFSAGIDENAKGVVVHRISLLADRVGRGRKERGGIQRVGIRARLNKDGVDTDQAEL